MIKADTRHGHQKQHIYKMEDDGSVTWVGWLKRQAIGLGKWEWYWAKEGTPPVWNGPLKSKKAAMELLS